MGNNLSFNRQANKTIFNGSNIIINGNRVNFTGVVLTLEIIEPGALYMVSNNVNTYREKRGFINKNFKNINSLIVNILSVDIEGKITSIEAGAIRGIGYEVGDIISINEPSSNPNTDTIKIKIKSIKDDLAKLDTKYEHMFVHAVGLFHSLPHLRPYYVCIVFYMTMES